ncbi:oxidoreductase, variant 2 [Sphaerosporella brunnea]|uniref:Oxidoreductase, variant 2 n=1 Tax=Sphaerosporella brunnea TaxID=1250544 RepID=A0A5J5F367_9PEZI|nr:oxidoreductase, variant 2 [Sphaerosporella brunnea]
MLSETLDPPNQKRGDFKQAMNFGEFTASGEPQQPITAALSPHIPAIAAFSAQCAALSRRIMRLFAQALKIAPDAGGKEYFTACHTSANGPSGSIMRLLYYPAAPPDFDPASDIRAGAHSDYGSLTLLFQHRNETGLEILSPNGGWNPVPVVPEAICVNIGDLLSYWTGGLLRSTIHRVVVPKDQNGDLDKAERYSMVYFCHPVDTTPLVVIPSEMVRARGGRGANDTERKVLTAAEHLKSRLAATYGWKN